MSSSHVFSFGNRNPFGGGPAGVASREDDVENAHTEGLMWARFLDVDVRISAAVNLVVAILVMK